MSAGVEYQAFLENKRVVAPPAGFRVTDEELNQQLYQFQHDIVRWALARGKAALFADCGLGKTPCQLEWARHVCGRTGGNVLILAPLAVANQTQREGRKFGIDVTVCRTQDDVRPGINITNYEMLPHFEPSAFVGVVLDESSILKSFDGKLRQQITEAFSRTPYRMACTATPSPNDHMELGTHAEFLGVMTRPEMLAMFFINDGEHTTKWRLKGHAEEAFWRWVASWACILRKPSDLGYADGGFSLPPLRIEHHRVEGETPEGRLFAIEAQSLTERREARRATIDRRVAAAAGLANAVRDSVVVWCDLNAESEALAAAIPDAVEVRGSDHHTDKEQALIAFTTGAARVIVTKPSIAGYGLNWQHCAHVVFVGLSDSYEQYYQAIRRCWRFGQTRPVTVHVITAESEGAVVQNIQRKELQAAMMYDAMVEHTRAFVTANVHESLARDTTPYREDTSTGDGWTMHLGDCIEWTRKLADDSIDYSIFSPPFTSLYTYSDSDRDLGNSTNDGEFFAHMEYLIAELYRALKPGRLLSFHCMNLPTAKCRDGVIGIRDFRGDLIRAFTSAGFIYHSEVCIWKDPVTAMQRTKALGLLYKQLRKDSCMSRQGIADYLVTMRKPGDNHEPVTKTHEGFPVSLWQNYASPVWMDINQSRTLQRESAREERDERHICPLQLDVIERAVRLWTNPNDLVLSPFAGIGSEGVVSLEMGRRFVGIELKRSYYEQACRNLERVRRDAIAELDLFGQLEDVANA